MASPARSTVIFVQSLCAQSVSATRAVRADLSITITLFSAPNMASTDDFHEQAQVINSASQVFIDAFGEEGRHARSAIGSNALPLGLAVEVESIFEIEEA